MAKVLLILTLLVASLFEASNSVLDVFETGKFSTTYYQVEETDLVASPPKPSLIVTPIVKVIFMPNKWSDTHATCKWTYRTRFRSRSYKLVTSGLQSVLPENVKSDLNKLSIGGHSGGGKIAFALTLGYAKTLLKLKFSALAGLDPVEGMSKNNPTQPKTLTYIPRSFNLSIPATVIGTGLGNEPICWLVCPACAPNEVNHEEFYNECKAPASHFVTTEYDHMDMLNDNITDIVGRLSNSLCKSSQSPKEPMRRTMGGIVVAFMKAYFEGEIEDYMTIVQEPSVAPVKLDPVQLIEA